MEPLYKIVFPVFQLDVDVCECIVSLNNFRNDAVCKVQPLFCVQKMLATTANGLFVH